MPDRLESKAKRTKPVDGVKSLKIKMSRPQIPAVAQKDALKTENLRGGVQAELKLPQKIVLINTGLLVGGQEASKYVQLASHQDASHQQQASLEEEPDKQHQDDLQKESLDKSLQDAPLKVGKLTMNTSLQDASLPQSTPEQETPLVILKTIQESQPKVTLNSTQTQVGELLSTPIQHVNLPLNTSHNQLKSPASKDAVSVLPECPITLPTISTDNTLIVLPEPRQPLKITFKLSKQPPPALTASAAALANLSKMQMGEDELKNVTQQIIEREYLNRQKANVATLPLVINDARLYATSKESLHLGSVVYTGAKFKDVAESLGKPSQLTLFLLPSFERDMLGSTITVRIPGTFLVKSNIAVVKHALWGTDFYTDDSDIVAGTSKLIQLLHIRNAGTC